MFLIACNSGLNKNASNDTSAMPPVVADASQAAVLKFEADSYDFGLINTGEKVSHDYKFTNSGKTPLIISDAQASCGCTVPAYPKEPIPPGQSGIIKVVFNSAGKSGKQTKAITITSNAVPPTSTVYLNGEVSEVKQTK